MSDPPSVGDVSVGNPPADYVLPGGWYTLMAMLVITVFAFVDRQLITLAAAPIAKSLSLTDTELGIVQGLGFSIFSVIAVYPIAWLADRFDRRYVFAGCLLVWSTGTAACGFADSFHGLFAAAVLIAAGEAGLGPLTMAIVPDLFGGRKRATANAVQYVSTYATISVALAVGGFALSALDRAHEQLPAFLREFESWRVAFFVVVLPTPLLLVLVAFMRLPRPSSARSVAHQERPSSVGVGDLLRTHRAAIALVIGSLALYMLAFGVLSWLPVTTTRLFGATPIENGWGMGLAMGLGMFAGVSLGTTALRRLLPRIGRVAPVRIGWFVMLLGTPVLPAFAFVNSTAQAYTVMGLLMAAGTAVGVLVPMILQSMTTASVRVRFLALYTIAGTLFSGSAPSVVGVISDLIGGQRSILYALSLVASTAWVAATILLRMGERHFVAMAAEAARCDGAK